MLTTMLRSIVAWAAAAVVVATSLATSTLPASAVEQLDETQVAELDDDRGNGAVPDETVFASERVPTKL